MKSPKQLIDELRADGFTQARIAKLTRVTQATISRMQAGLSEGRATTPFVLSRIFLASPYKTSAMSI